MLAHYLAQTGPRSVEIATYFPSPPTTTETVRIPLAPEGNGTAEGNVREALTNAQNEERYDNRSGGRENVAAGLNPPRKELIMNWGPLNGAPPRVATGIEVRANIGPSPATPGFGGGLVGSVKQPPSILPTRTTPGPALTAAWAAGGETVRVENDAILDPEKFMVRRAVGWL